jgi:signal transduction histidine kinase
MIAPLVGVSMAVALLVAWGSAVQGRAWAVKEVRNVFAGIDQTLRRAAFPLTPSVLQSVAGLTDTDLITVDLQRRVLATTIEGHDRGQAFALPTQTGQPSGKSGWDGMPLTLGRERYLVYVMDRAESSRQLDQVARVFVLFKQDRIDAAARRAAALPLVTGLSTVLLLTTVMLVISSRLIHRLIRLEQSVGLVAAGQFDRPVSDHATDELGRLGNAVDSMSRQLNQLWEQVNRQQREKLVHQIAGGLAHQMRNTLTGSRLAMELHQRECPNRDHDDIAIAIRQLDTAEDYVRRMLQVGSGDQTADRPAAVRGSLDDVCANQAVVAKHLHVELDCHFEDALAGYLVADGPSFSAAISNLVLNAMQVARVVRVRADCMDGYCTVTVADDGPGIATEVRDSLFEPFVTSKAEGMGLGLPLVRRAANRLGGQVEWKRDGEMTVFTFVCQVSPNSTNEPPIIEPHD